MSTYISMQSLHCYPHTVLPAAEPSSSLPWILDSTSRGLPPPTFLLWLKTLCRQSRVWPMLMNPAISENLTFWADLPLSSVLEMRRAALSDCRLRFLSSSSTSRGLDESWWSDGGAGGEIEQKLQQDFFLSLPPPLQMFIISVLII